MEINFSLIQQAQSFAKAYLIFDRTFTDVMSLNEFETTYTKKQFEENGIVIVNRYNELIIVAFADRLKDKNTFIEQCRKRGNEISGVLHRENISEIDIIIPVDEPDGGLALAEGLSLGSYQFLKYRSPNLKKQWNLDKISLVGTNISKVQIDFLSIMVETVFIARDLVNEPASYLNAIKLSEAFVSMGKVSGFLNRNFS